MFHSDQISNVFRFYSGRNKQDNKLCFSEYFRVFEYTMKPKEAPYPLSTKLFFFISHDFPIKNES